MNPRRLALLLQAGAVFAAAPLSPEQERAAFRFADPSLVADLVAAEPDVQSPVAMTWDAEGRFYVAEMRDYPNASIGGTIRMFEGEMENGRYRSSKLFAEKLSFPISVLPWNGGILVTAAPDLIFLRDTDGDGRADERRVLFTGFGTGNQQLRVNGLFWGLDNWVYGANGRSDGEIVRPGFTNKWPLRGRDFRFRPDTGEFETLAGRSQFGHARDDWGNRFLSWNTIPIRHEVFPDRFLAGDGRLAAVSVIADCSPPGDSGEVFPLTPPPLVFNNESSSHFNALAGLHIFRGDRLGPSYNGNAFVGESLRNLVHRRVLAPDGPTYRAMRAEPRAEFLASSDPWFHPVNFATGPDGSLYIADFYRQFVEHPDWVPKEMRETVPWRTGSEHGRIWRVRARVIPASAKGFESANGWQRDVAQRKLIEQRDVKAARAALQSGRAETRVAALYTLRVLDSLDASAIRGALLDRHPEARAAAASFAPADLLAGVRDEHPRVQVQLALKIGEKEVDGATNRWIRLAAASASPDAPWIAEFLQTLQPRTRPAPKLASPNPDRKRVVEQFKDALSRVGDATRGGEIAARLCLSCHYLQGQGQRVGPDFSGLSTRPSEALLTDILDPNLQVAPDYAAYEIDFKTKDRETLSGLIASETATRLTIRHPGSPDESISRSEVQDIRPAGKSLMPDGLEAGLTAQDLADLIQFLRASRLPAVPQ